MRVLLPVDGSYHSDAAVESVVNTTWPEGTTFCITTVAEPLHKFVDGCFGSFGKLALQAQQELDGDIHKVLAEAAGKLRTKFGADKVTDQYSEGVVADQILEQAKKWKADLIVMGSHGNGGYNDDGLGSVCLRVTAHAPCSVRIIQDGNMNFSEKKGPPKTAVQSRILLPINESKNSMAAVDEVMNQPWPKDAKVQVLVVVGTKGKSSNSRFFKAPAISDGLTKIHDSQKAEAEKLAKDVADKLAGKFGKANTSFHVLEGSVRSLILQIAQDWPADLIIMGAHDQDKSVLETLFGSVARAVVSNADCSVEIVRKH
jgi:nucleotide-binding universal stress UspA family protein